MYYRYLRNSPDRMTTVVQEKIDGAEEDAFEVLTSSVKLILKIETRVPDRGGRPQFPRCGTCGP